MATRQAWVITTTGERSILDVAKDLAARGLAIDHILSEIGCIIGTGEAETLSALRQVSGILDISPEAPVEAIGSSTAASPQPLAPGAPPSAG